MENLPEEVIYNIAEFLEYRNNNRYSPDLISFHFVNKTLFNMYKFDIREILKLLSAKYVKTSMIRAYDGRSSCSISRDAEEMHECAIHLQKMLEKLNIKVPPTRSQICKYYNILYDIGKFYIFEDVGDKDRDNEDYYPSGGYMRHYLSHVVSINDKNYVIFMNKLCPLIHKF
jgi:hypothetical protein